MSTVLDLWPCCHDSSVNVSHQWVGPQEWHTGRGRSWSKCNTRLSRWVQYLTSDPVVTTAVSMSPTNELDLKNDIQVEEEVGQSAIVTIQNGWNNRISYGCVYAQIRSGLGMHLVTYSNHDTVLFLLIVPIKGRFVWDGIHCIYIYQRLHVFLILLEYLGNLVRFSIYKGWNFPFLLGDILNIPLKGSI